MPAVLTVGSAVQCLHQGAVQLVASQQKLKVRGQAVLVLGDLVGKPIAGCSTPASSGPPPTKPCMTTSGMSAGAATKLRVEGRPVLLDMANGTTDGVPPPPPLPAAAWRVAAAGETTLMAR